MDLHHSIQRAHFNIEFIKLFEITEHQTIIFFFYTETPMKIIFKKEKYTKHHNDKW